MSNEWLFKFASYLDQGLLSMFGGIISYLYKLFNEAEKWDPKRFILTATIAFGTGVMVGAFLSENLWARDGWLLLTGYLCFQILAIVENNREKLSNFISGLLK